MKRQRLWMAAAMIGLSAPLLASISGPAQAQSYESAPYHRYDRYGNSSGNYGNYGYGNYPTYPRMQAMRRVGILAENVEAAAVRLEQDTFIRRSSLSWGRYRVSLSQWIDRQSSQSHPSSIGPGSFANRLLRSRMAPEAVNA